MRQRINAAAALVLGHSAVGSSFRQTLHPPPFEQPLHGSGGDQGGGRSGSGGTSGGNGKCGVKLDAVGPGAAAGASGVAIAKSDGRRQAGRSAKRRAATGLEPFFTLHCVYSSKYIAQPLLRVFNTDSTHHTILEHTHHRQVPGSRKSPVSTVYMYLSPGTQPWTRSRPAFTIGPQAARRPPAPT